MSKSKQWCNSHRVSADDAQCFNGFYEFVSYIIHSNIKKNTCCFISFYRHPRKLTRDNSLQIRVKTGSCASGQRPTDEPEDETNPEANKMASNQVGSLKYLNMSMHFRFMDFEIPVFKFLHEK